MFAFIAKTSVPQYLDISAIENSKEAKALTYWTISPLQRVSPNVVSFPDSLVNQDTARDIEYGRIKFYNSNTVDYGYWTAYCSNVAPSGVEQLARVVDGDSDDDSIVVVDIPKYRDESTRERYVFPHFNAIPSDFVEELRTLAGMKNWNRFLNSSGEYGLTATGNVVHRERFVNMIVHDDGSLRQNVTNNNVGLDNKGTKAQTKRKSTLGTTTEGYNQDKAALNRIDCNAYTIPVQACLVSSSFTAYDIDSAQEPPFTPVYQQFLSRITENDAQSALRSMISRACISDGSLYISITEKISTMMGGSFRDVQPLLTCHLLLDSLCLELAKVSGQFYKLLRNTTFEKDNLFLSILPQPITTKPTVTFCHFDAFVKIITGITPLPVASRWHYSKFETTWIAIPISSGIKLQRDVFGYVFSYMDSQYWNGSVNHVLMINQVGGVEGTYGSTSLMPSSNSVHMPGVTNIMLVFTDGTSNCNVTLHANGTDIPFSPDAAHLQDVDLSPAWTAAWKTEQADYLRQQFHLAYHFIMNNLVVGDTAGRALSLAAELSCKMSPGFMLNYTNKVIDNTPDGLWATVDQYVYGKNKYVCSNILAGSTALQHDKTNRRITGYNWGLSSPLGNVASAWSDVKWGNYNISQSEKCDVCFWKRNTPTGVAAHGYMIQRARSLYRIAAQIHLLETHPINGLYHFRVPDAHQTFIHHLGSALFGSTCLFELSNDIQHRFWVGWENSTHHGYCSSLIELKKRIFLGQVYANNPCDLFGFAHTIDCIADYYGVDYPDEASWFVNNPYPLPCTIQWAIKVDDMTARPDMTATSITYGKDHHYGVTVTKEWKVQKAAYCGAVSDESVVPGMYVVDPLMASSFMQGMWVDSFEVTSTINMDRGDVPMISATDTIVPENLDIWMTSTTYTRSLSVPIEFDLPTNLIKLVRGNMSPGKYDCKVIVSPIVLPDPFSLDGFLSWLRDYAVRPVVAGAKEFATSKDPFKAGAAALTTIEQEADKRQQKEDERERMRQEQENKKSQPIEMASEVHPEIPTALIEESNPVNNP